MSNDAALPDAPLQSERVRAKGRVPEHAQMLCQQAQCGYPGRVGPGILNLVFQAPDDVISVIRRTLETRYSVTEI